MKKIILSLSILVFSSSLHAMGESDPLLGQFMIEELEIRDTGGPNPEVWDVAAWVGRDINKFHVQWSGERERGDTEDEELHLLYGRAIKSYWDLMAGVRIDKEPGPHRKWLEIGIQGTAPYFIETTASLFIGENGRSGLRLQLEREFMITQRWVLIPEIEVDFYGQNDEATGKGARLSHVEAGIRLGYEVRREFMPYIGLNWERSYGNTARYLRDEDEAVEDTQVVMGFRAWF